MGSFTSRNVDPLAVKDMVEATIAGNSVTIFSKSHCVYCQKAKRLFASQYPGVQPKILELDQMEDGQNIQAYLLQRTGQRTVPNIFVNQMHIGGCDDLVAANARGKLKNLLATIVS